MTFLFAVEAGDLGKILAIGTSHTSGARRVNTDDGGRALSTLLSISMTLFPLLLLPSLFIKSLAIFGPQRIWMQRV